MREQSRGRYRPTQEARFHPQRSVRSPNAGLPQRARGARPNTRPHSSRKPGYRGVGCFTGGRPPPPTGRGPTPAGYSGEPLRWQGRFWGVIAGRRAAFSRQPLRLPQITSGPRGLSTPGARAATAGSGSSHPGRCGPKPGMPQPHSPWPYPAHGCWVERLCGTARCHSPGRSHASQSRPPAPNRDLVPSRSVSFSEPCGCGSGTPGPESRRGHARRWGPAGFRSPSKANPSRGR